MALTGDPDYRIVMEAYPFVTRKIISDDSPALQRALRDILYRYVCTQRRVEVSLEAKAFWHECSSKSNSQSSIGSHGSRHTQATLLYHRTAGTILKGAVKHDVRGRDVLLSILQWSKKPKTTRYT